MSDLKRMAADSEMEAWFAIKHYLDDAQKPAIAAHMSLHYLQEMLNNLHKASNAISETKNRRAA